MINYDLTLQDAEQYLSQARLHLQHGWKALASNNLKIADKRIDEVLADIELKDIATNILPPQKEPATGNKNP